MNKIVSYIKKNKSNIIFLALGLILLFSADAKAYLQQGLMKVGFFQPDLEKKEIVNPNNLNTYSSFKMINQKGETITLGDLKGKVVFINFWATWCPPCIAEMPSIQVLYDKFKDDNEVVILTLEVEGKADKADKFMKRKNLNLPVYFPQSSIPRELFNGSLPTTVILDKQGNIAHITLGMADYSGQDIVDFLNEIKQMH